MENEINNNPVLKNVKQLLMDQTEKGLVKYGHTVDFNSLSTIEWIDHASQEIIDNLVYLQALKLKILKGEGDEPNC